MKKAIISSMLGLCIFFSLTVQAKSDINIPEDFYQYMTAKLKYPGKAKQANLQGNSMILFTLSDGKLSNIKIETELGEGCDVEVLNTLMAYQHFKSIKNGKYALITSFSLTGSTAVIKNENVQAPEGFEVLKITVVAPSVSQNVVIRGYAPSAKAFAINNTNSGNMVFNGTSTHPKVYIDSVQVDYEELGYVIPSDIQSIHIYKGISAIANYGTDAINGAIVIVTKKEKALPKKEAPANKQN